MKEIKITTNKDGQQKAYYFSRRQMRSFPMPLEVAKLEIATEQAVRVERFVIEPSDRMKLYN